MNRHAIANALRAAIFLVALLFVAAPVLGQVRPVDAAVSAPAPIVSVQTAAPDPLTCAGYPEPRVFVEIQSWWQDRVGEAWPGRHIHIGMCWPTGVVTGTVTVDLRVILHAQPRTPANAKLFRVRIKDAGVGDVWVCTPGKATCPSPWPTIDANGDLTAWFKATVPTTGKSNGLHEMQVAAYVKQPGKVASTDDDFDQFVSSGLPMFYRSMSGGSTTRDYVEARSWYPGFLYTNTRYRGRLADFLTPKSGTWTPTLECASPSGVNGKRFVVAIDPSYHDLILGDVVLDVPGEAKRTLSIDTTDYAVGGHKIVSRCEGGPYNLSGHDGTSSGVEAINFTVAR